jgi:hypothetical protein
VAQPTPYVRSYSFGSASGAVAPGPIDQNFDLVRVTLDQILNNLELLQRDDTELANETVGYDQLKPELSILFTPPSAWATATAYTARVSTVFSGDSFYQALTTHTSGVFATDLAAGKWVLIADFGDILADLAAGALLPGVAHRSANFSISVADAGKTFLVEEDTFGVDVTASLPAASTFTAGQRVLIKKRGRVKFTRIVVSGSDRFDDDGPQFAISNITSSSGVLITLPQVAGRSLTTGRKVLVSGVAGDLASLNGVHSWTNVSLSTGKLTGVAYPGGSYSAASDFVTLITTEIVLRVQGEFVELESDGASRWTVVGEGTGRFNLTRDYLWGPNLSYTGGQVQLGQLPFIDFWISGLYRRMGTPTIVVTERGDPPEIQCANVGLAPGSPYPDGSGDGTGHAATPAGEGLGIFHGSTWDGTSAMNPRSAAIAIEALEAGDDSNGGQMRFSAAEDGVGAAAGNDPIQQLNITERAVTFGTGNNSDAKVNVVISDTSTTAPNRPALLLHHLATTLNTNIFEIRGPAVSTYVGGGYNFWACKSDDGADTEGRFRSTGALEIDGAVSSPAADFAEFSLPWWDGNPQKVDRRGMTVVQVREDDHDVVIWPGDRGHRKSVIRLFDDMPKGTPAEAIWAPTTSNPAILGGAYALNWKGKFETDSLGSVVREEAEWVTWTEYEIWNEAKKTDSPVLGVVSVKEYALYPDRATPQELAAMPPDSGETLEEVKARVRAAVTKDPTLYRGFSRLKWSSPPKRTLLQRKKWSEAFDPAEENVPRAERADWFTAALSKVGDVWVRNDQTLHPAWSILEETDDAVLVSVFDARAKVDLGAILERLAKLEAARPVKSARATR